MRTRNYLAIDLGAESGRTMVGSLEDDNLVLRETYRFNNGPVSLNDGLHWDVLNQWAQIKEGIRASVIGFDNQICSIGVDAWGVDFGLLDRQGALLGNPFHHRDSRTDGLIEVATQLMSRSEIYAHTGIQFMQINTLFQLLAMRNQKSPLFDIAHTLLTIPDLFNYWLSGVITNEFTNATTTQCLNPNTRSWATMVLEKLDIPRSIFGSITSPGTQIGELKDSVARDTASAIVPIIAPACHDTGSAVVAVPAETSGFAWISSGTWSILGIEVERPIINEVTLEKNFTNEGGVQGNWRLSKNVMGLWILQECRRQWSRQGENYSYSELTNLANKASAFISFVDPDSSKFLHPGDMPTRLQEYCARTNQVVPMSKGDIVRVILESIALKYRRGLAELSEVTGMPLEPVYIIGGGSRNELLNQFTANATKRMVVSGPVEAASVGNIMMQAIALKHLDNLSEARSIIRKSLKLKVYEPERQADWDEAYRRFEQLLESNVFSISQGIQND